VEVSTANVNQQYYAQVCINYLSSFTWTSTRYIDPTLLTVMCCHAMHYITLHNSLVVEPEVLKLLIPNPNIGKKIRQFHSPPTLTSYYPKVHLDVILPSPSLSHK